MCRICGRMVKCIFDSMPSRVPSSYQRRSLSSWSRQSTSSKHTATPARNLRTALQIDKSTTASPNLLFLLPIRAGYSTSSPKQATISQPTHFQHTHVETPPSVQPIDDTASTSIIDAPPVRHNLTDAVSGSDQPLVLSKSLLTLLPALSTQTPHYVTIHIHRFPYLLTNGDTLRLPFHMHGVSVGDVLRLDRASLLGSRDYTLKAGTVRRESYDGKLLEPGKGPQYLDNRLFVCRARVMGVESTPMSIKEKTKRRQRRIKTVKSKHRYTVLKVMEVRVKTLEELKEESDIVIEADI